MVNLHEIYKCNICGNIIDVVHGGQGTLVCCGQQMIVLKAQTADWKNEKHVPVIESAGEDKMRVEVGSTPHPMDKDHYIEWIEIYNEKKLVRRYFKPGDKAKTSFKVKNHDEWIVREYCNKHGLWSNAKPGKESEMVFKQ